MNEAAASKVAAETLAYGGGTFIEDGSAIRPAYGYAVAVASIAKVDIGPALARGARATAAAAITRALRADHGASSTIDGLIGTWLDDGIVHIDKVVILTSRADAETLGRAFRQLAIYSFLDRESIALDDGDSCPECGSIGGSHCGTCS